MSASADPRRQPDLYWKEMKIFRLDTGEGFGKSIFPPFNVNVPMPAGTPIPPVVIVTAPSRPNTPPDLPNQPQSRKSPA